MKKVMFIILFLVLSLPGLSFSAGTITETFTDFSGSNNSIVTLAWISDASGALSVNTTATATAFIQGKILYAVTTTPGDVSPTTLYDVSINDSLGIDIMGATLANRSNTISQRAIPALATGIYGGVLVDGTLTLVITNNSQAAAKGTIRLFLTR